MPINTEYEEIKPGIVVFMDVSILKASKDIRVNDESVKPGSIPPENHYFACIEAFGDSSSWVIVTSTCSDKRLLIRKEWKAGGKNLKTDAAWFVNNHYIQDGRYFLKAIMIYS